MIENRLQMPFDLVVGRDDFFAEFFRAAGKILFVEIFLNVLFDSTADGPLANHLGAHDFRAHRPFARFGPAGLRARRPIPGRRLFLIGAAEKFLDFVLHRACRGRPRGPHGSGGTFRRRRTF